jgi:hypothetical protein
MKLKRSRDGMKKYKDNISFKQSIPKTREVLDYELLLSIIGKYNLSGKNEEKLIGMVEKRFHELGFSVIPNYGIDDENKSNRVFVDLSYTVVDEYIVESMRGLGDFL